MIKEIFRSCMAVFAACLCLHVAAHTAKDAVAIRNSIDQFTAGTMKFDRFFNTYHDSAVYKIYIKDKKENLVRTTLD